MFVEKRGQIRGSLTGLFFLSIILTLVNGERSVAIEEGKFAISTLSDAIKHEMKEKKTWTPECPVALDRLRLVQFSYYDFDTKPHDTGEMIVLDAVAEAVKSIFQELYKNKFPIAQARRIEYYNGRDEDSMADNNSSAFNFRPITGGGVPSLHGYGVAIDINPVQNPYIAPQKTDDKTKGMAEILPSEGNFYLNRTNLRPGMVESVIAIFQKHGFHIWGGKWNTPIDWQHFQPSRPVAQLLAAMAPKDAAELFKMYASSPTMLNSINPQNNQFIGLYESNAKGFVDLLRTQPDLLTLDAQTAYEIMKQKLNYHK